MKLANVKKRVILVFSTNGAEHFQPASRHNTLFTLGRLRRTLIWRWRAKIPLSRAFSHANDRNKYRRMPPRRGETLHSREY